MSLPILLQKSAGRQWPLVAVVELDVSDLPTGEETPVIQVPGDSIVVGGEFIVTEAFGTGNEIDVGDTDTDDRYLDGQAVTTLGRTALGLTGHRYTEPKNLTVTRAGTADGGAGILIVEYVMLYRATETQSVREDL